MLEGKYYGGNMEHYKHLLLTGDCNGSPANFGLGYTGNQEISASLWATPPRECENQLVVSQY